VDYFPTGSCPLAAERHVSNAAHVAMPWGAVSSRVCMMQGYLGGVVPHGPRGNCLWLIVKQADGLARFLAVSADTYGYIS